MTGNALRNLEQIEFGLRDAADRLRAIPKPIAGEYAMPPGGVLHPRPETNR